VSCAFELRFNPADWKRKHSGEGRTANTQRGGYASSIVGGRFLVAEIRSLDDVNYYPTDCLIGSSGRAFVGSTSAEGGNLIETSFGEGDD